MATAQTSRKQRCTLLRRVDPVLRFQRGHPRKLPHVVRHQHQAFAASVRSNMHVVHTDRLAEFFQGGANGAVVLRGLGAKGQNF